MISDLNESVDYFNVLLKQTELVFSKSINLEREAKKSLFSNLPYNKSAHLKILTHFGLSCLDFLVIHFIVFRRLLHFVVTIHYEVLDVYLYICRGCYLLAYESKCYRKQVLPIFRAFLIFH